jgi:hypothetical protein
VHERREDRVERLDVARAGNERRDVERRRPSREVVGRVDHDLVGERPARESRLRPGRGKRDDDDIARRNGLATVSRRRDDDLVPFSAPGRRERAPTRPPPMIPIPHDSQ